MTPAGGDVLDEEEANLEEMEVVEPDDKGADGLEEKKSAVDSWANQRPSSLKSSFFFLSFFFM